MSLLVTGTGTIPNTTGVVSANESGPGNVSNTATLEVVQPPTVNKAFGAASIPLNGTTSLTFNVANPNSSTPLVNVSLNDTLPAGLIVSNPNGLTGSCMTLSIITANVGSGSIGMTDLSLPPAGSCSFSVNVTGTTAGTKNNATDNINATFDDGSGTYFPIAGGTASASIFVVAPPTISDAFAPGLIVPGGVSTLSFTLTNPAANAVAESGVAFTDTLPANLIVATPNGLSSSCGGTATATAGTGSISLTGGSIAVAGSCAISVNVTSAIVGSYTNFSGAVSSTNGGTGAISNAVDLTVANPATATKTFAPTKIPLNGTTLLTISITNPNSTVSLPGLAFTDNLPAGLVVAPTPNLTNTCGGTAAATAGASSVSLSGATLAATASCSVSVNLQGTTAGDKNNSVQVNSTSGGGSSNIATASLTVVAPPTISKTFGAGSIPLNGTTTVTFTISNPNNSATPANGDLTGVAFSDTLPVSSGVGSATLTIAATPGVSNTCGGTVTATAGSGVISLSGGSVTHNTSCTLTVNVSGTVAGDANNTTGAISSTEGGTGTTSNTATVKVVAPPSIAAAFNPSTIPVNGTASLTFTITNPAVNTTPANGVAFTDTLPTNLVVATPSGLTSTCGGTTTAVAGSGTVSLAGATVAVASACTITVNVTGSVIGSYSNTTGAVTSTNGGTGNTASANLGVENIAITPTTLPNGTVTVAYAQIIMASGGTAPYTFSITSGVLPAGLTLGSNGALSGTPTTAATSNFTVTAKDTNNLSAAQSYTLTIGKKSTSISVSATPNPVIVGQAVTITATVAGDPPTGNVNFTDNGIALPCSPVTLVPGTTSSAAVCTATFAGTGSHSIVAAYSGDSNFEGATSSALVITVTTVPVAAPMLDRWAMIVLGSLLVSMLWWLRRAENHF